MFDRPESQWAVVPMEEEEEINEHRLRVFENSAGGIFGPKRDEVTGEWGRLHNDDIYDLYCTPNIIKMINNEE